MRILVAGLDWGYWGRLEPDCLDNPRRSQVAGGETAMLRGAFGMAEQGHEVVVCSTVFPGRHRKVTFHDSHEFFPLVLDGGPWDAMIIFGEPDLFAPLTDAGALDGTLRVCAQQVNTFRLADAAHHFVDAYVFPSKTHANMLAGQYALPAEKVHVIHNAVEPTRFSWKEPREPFAVYYASSPDRGLHHLLKAWPAIRKAEPRATLTVFYQYKRWLEAVETQTVMAPVLRTRAQMVRDGIAIAQAAGGATFPGSVPQQSVIDKACRSGVLCYPCDPIGFTEGFATTVLEGWVAGCNVVISNADALPELYEDKAYAMFDIDRLATCDLSDAVLGAIFQAEKAQAAGDAGADGRAHSSATLRGRAIDHSWTMVGIDWHDMLVRERKKKSRRSLEAPALVGAGAPFLPSEDVVPYRMGG